MYKNILIPIAPDHSPLTGRAIEVASKLLAEGGKITALTVVEPTPTYISTYIPEDMMEEQRKDIMARLKAEVSEISSASAHVITGHAGATIVDYAKEHEADCIIIASHKPGMQDFFLGSTASRVVRHASCAVHVIR